MITFYAMSGFPGAGKSTLSRRLAEKLIDVRLSFDELNLFRNSELNNLIKYHLQQNKSVIADHLYPRRQDREELLQLISDIKCPKICLYISTPLDICIERVNQRKEHMAKDMMEYFAMIYEPPTIEEGWDKVLVFDGTQPISLEDIK